MPLNKQIKQIICAYSFVYALMINVYITCMYIKYIYIYKIHEYIYKYISPLEYVLKYLVVYIYIRIY